MYAMIIQKYLCELIGGNIGISFITIIKNSFIINIRQMWQVYPYGHTKLRLGKDLKTGDAHLRISLIDQEQIQNMTRIYNSRKQYYKFDETTLIAPTYVEEKVEQQTTAHLSYKQKVDLYRKRLQNEKLQDKYNNLFKKTEKRKYKMRKPVLYKLLQNFQEGHKHQDSVKVSEDLKQSQKNLQMIRINTNRRARFPKNSGNSTVLDRPRFLSLQNGLPERQTQVLPNWVDFLEGKFTKPDKAVYQINIQDFSNRVDSEIQKCVSKHKKNNYSKDIDILQLHKQTGSPVRQKLLLGTKSTFIQPQTSINDQDKQHTFSCKRCNIQQPQTRREGNFDQEGHTKHKTQQKYYTSHNINNERKRLFSKQSTGKRMNPSHEHISKTAERTFTKSECYSKQVIATMSGFYECKNNKKEDYKKMVYHLKNDRPLTSDIRRKNYKLIGQQNIQQVKNYRAHSQQQRLKLKSHNYQFYLQLLHKMSSHNIEQLHLSGKIMERLRTVFQSNYAISMNQYQYIAEPSLYQQRDAKSEYILARIQDYIDKFQHL